MKITQFYRKSKVLEKIPFSESTLFRRIQEGNFPKPYQLSGRTVGWSAEEVDEWLNSRERASGGSSK